MANTTIEVASPNQEPVQLAWVKTALRLPTNFTVHDDLITGLIRGARTDGERLSGLMLAKRQFNQVLDSPPYYTDTIQSQLSYPPSFYSLPRYSTTLWNYSQMIKLGRAPVHSVDAFTYIGTDGQPHTLQPGVDFIIDPLTKLARIFPAVGQSWKPALYVPNSISILFTAGYDQDPDAVTVYGLPSPPPSPPNQQPGYTMLTGIPHNLKDAITALAVHRYQYPAQAGVPRDIELAFMANGTGDLFAPTRG